MSEKPFLFQKVGNTPIIPISVKILGVFLCLLLFSNFATNYINILLNQRQVISLTNQLLVKELKEMYTQAGNQYEIYKFSGDEAACLDSISRAAEKGFTRKHSMALGAKENGDLLFFTIGSGQQMSSFPDNDALNDINTAKNEGIKEGSVYFNSASGRYLAVYKYHDDWNCYLVRAELISDMHSESNTVFLVISGIIVVLTIIFIILGFFMFSRILKYVRQMTESLYAMQKKQSLELLDLKGAPNDDITYLGASFNSLSSTINNLLSIFRRFTTRDVVEQAYREHHVGLEGTQRDLTILFSDIRGFTYMTETLGNDIINLLNIHYSRAINGVHEQDGIIGSIIGDAVLAIYGALDTGKNKSLQALHSAWTITEETAKLREKMKARRKEIEQERPLTESEERVFKAVLIDVGVGIDGGTVFYGNIGSVERMTTTVIGDNVNSASRLEGLTRIYHLPVIVSEFVKDDVLSITGQYKFFEIDTVQVKGKTEGKRIYFPYDVVSGDKELENKFEIFSKGLTAYYKGDWDDAKPYMRDCGLELAGVFIERMNHTKPRDWSGIWTMTSK